MKTTRKPAKVWRKEIMAMKMVKDGTWFSQHDLAIAEGIEPSIASRHLMSLVDQNMLSVKKVPRSGGTATFFCRMPRIAQQPWRVVSNSDIGIKEQSVYGR